MPAASLAITCSLATVAYSTSLSLSPADLANSYTCCFCSSSASGVKLGTCQNTSFFARCAWLLPTIHHGELAAVAVTPAAFRSCRRGTVRSAIATLRGLVAAASARRPLALDGAQRQALDHPALEDQVQENRGHRREAGRPHHRPPEEHVLHDEQREAGGDGPDIDAVDEHVGRA